MTPKKILFMLVPAAFLAFTGCASHRIEPPEAPPARTVVSNTVPEAPTPAPRARRISRGSRQETPAMQTVQAMPPQQLEPRPAAMPQILASHETEFDAKAKNRATNITKAAASIDGHVVNPGEVFSYNETVGPTNQRRGYKKDTIFVRGEKKKGFGGGVCQVSTTLYNAAANAGMTILERHDHSLPVTYAESGKEAATSYGGIDFKFQNDKPFPIVIHCRTENGKIYVTINAV